MLDNGHDVSGKKVSPAKEEKNIDMMNRKWNGWSVTTGHKCFIYFRVTLMPFLAPDLQKLAISEFPNFDESENY